MGKKLTQEQFLEKCRKAHDNKYDYSRVVYKNSKSIIEIYCKKHDTWFNQNAFAHSTGATSCPGCISEIRANNPHPKAKEDSDSFKDKMEKRFGDKFNFSNIEYIDRGTEICFSCNRCGSKISKTPRVLLHSKEPCSKCSHTNAQKDRTYDTEKFIELARKVHGDKYDYSITNYINCRTLISYRCNVCGNIMTQKPRSHLEGHGCKTCADKEVAETLRKSAEQFIEEAIEMHGDKYDYSQVEYINNRTKVKIYCKRCKKFFNQTPRSHLSGQGCPKCKLSKGIKKIIKFLNNKNIKFRLEKTFDNCINPITGKLLRFDLYLKDYNMVIEYDGEQHYKENAYHNRRLAIQKGKTVKEIFEYQTFRDNLKNEYCQNNNIKMIRIREYDKNRIDEILSLVF